MTLDVCAQPMKLSPRSAAGETLLWARLILVAAGLLLSSCRSADSPAESSQPELVVAAAANLTEAFREIGDAFTRETGTKIIYNFGATTQLAQQIENGAPFDLFAAADAIHVDQLVESGKVLPDSRAVFARGRLALWIPDNSQVSITDVIDLLQPAVRFIAIANPDIAPYGAAAVEALQKQNLWDRLQPKIVRAENVNAAKQLAATGNAEAAFTAYSLVLNEPGRVLLIDEAWHSPIDQALGVVASSAQRERAMRFENFVLSEKGRAILTRFGYAFPRSQ
jgi:molybdate transport system substrate-binding protein